MWSLSSREPKRVQPKTVPLHAKQGPAAGLFSHFICGRNNAVKNGVTIKASF